MNSSLVHELSQHLEDPVGTTGSEQQDRRAGFLQQQAVFLTCFRPHAFVKLSKEGGKKGGSEAASESLPNRDIEIKLCK